MIKFEKPLELNGTKLIEELLEKGVRVELDNSYPSGYTAPRLDADGSLWLAIPQSDEALAQSVIEAHNK